MPYPVIKIHTIKINDNEGFTYEQVFNEKNEFLGFNILFSAYNPDEFSEPWGAVVLDGELIFRGMPSKSIKNGGYVYIPCKIGDYISFGQKSYDLCKNPTIQHYKKVTKKLTLSNATRKTAFEKSRQTYRFNP